jgi:hypothetical protein
MNEEAKRILDKSYEGLITSPKYLRAIANEALAWETESGKAIYRTLTGLALFFDRGLMSTDVLELQDEIAHLKSRLGMAEENRLKFEAFWQDESKEKADYKYRMELLADAAMDAPALMLNQDWPHDRREEWLRKVVEIREGKNGKEEK